MALTAEDKKRLNKDQQSQIEAYTKAWNDANAKGDKTAMDKAASSAKLVREGSGYTSNSDGSYKTNRNTSVYKNEAYANKVYSDTTQKQIGNTGKVSYSQEKSNSRNATAWIPGVGNVRVTIENGRVQDTGLPVDTVITPDGNNQSWKINGATRDGYTSELYTGKVESYKPQNSPVSSNNSSSSYSSGSYSYKNDLPNASNSTNNIYAEILKQQQQALAEAERKAAEAQRLAVDKGVNTLNSQKVGLQQQTDAALKQTYVNNMLGNQNLEQQLKAQGLTGGLSESSMLDKRTAYENVLNDTRLAGNNALNAVDTDINNLKTTGDLNIANNANAYQNKLVDILGSNLDKQVNQFNVDRNFNYQIGRDAVSDQRYNQQWNYNVDRDQVSDQRYNQEWNYNVGRDNVNDNRYNRQWDYNVGRDQISDKRYNDETAYNRNQDVQDRNLAYQKYLNSLIPKEKETKYTQAQADMAIRIAANGKISDQAKAVIEGYYGMPIDTVLKEFGIVKFTSPGFVDNGNISPYDNGIVSFGLKNDISLPFPSPKSGQEVMENAIAMKNKGVDMELIKEYGNRYGMDLDK